jgi:hypothetical protein
MKSYPDCKAIHYLSKGWVGKDAISWGLKNSTLGRDNLIKLFEFYRQIGFFFNVVDQTKKFTDEYSFFSFREFAQDFNKLRQLVLVNQKLFMVTNLKLIHE